ncbi:MAG: HDOD domain-containing protein [Methylophaga sp.]|nr:HDOD domain-containing protein [Methylophaga sp.]
MSATLENTLPSGFEIPPQPAILQALRNEHAKKMPAMTAFAEIISKDIALAANVLKTVNSAQFGLPNKISDIRSAVVLLGMDAVENLVNFYELRKSLSGKASISLEKFWDQANHTAEMMLMLHAALNMGDDSCPKEDAYSFGLFRDCGIPLIAMKFPDYKQVLQTANNSPERVFTAVENDFYPTDHAVIGFFIAKSWHLPDTLIELILRHHDDSFLTDKTVAARQKTLYAMIKLASNILSHVKYQKPDSEWLLASAEALDWLKLSELDYEELHADLAERFAIEFDL